jgi:exosortase A
MSTRDGEALVEVPSSRTMEVSRAFPLAVLSTSIAALVSVYFEAFRSMVAIWSRSDTFAHGYFVVPISLYLIWTQRAELSKVPLRADPRALPLLAALGMGWLAARLAGVLVVEQYAATASIPVMVWAVLGLAVVRKLLFPLAYLLLAVPVGEALIPYLIDYTAAFTVTALRLSGVPVYQEGNFLTLPNSQWSVVEACSGLRYLIACITIGLLYAYLTYRSFLRRAAFIGLSVAVPIVANWLRAYMIVFLGYASDMKLAVGIDHLIYGWIFYGVVMVLLFWVGSLFRDPAGPEPVEPREEPPPPPRMSLGRALAVAFAAVLCASVWPVWAAYASPGDVEPLEDASFRFPESVAGWKYRDEVHDWQPYYAGADLTRSGLYVHASEGSWVGVHAAYYRRQSEESELVSSANALIGPDESLWRQLGRSSREARLSGGALSVEEGIVDAPGRELVVWKWFWVGGRRTSSEVWAKVLESRERLLFRDSPSTGFVVFTEALPDEDGARRRLESFLDAALAGLESGLSEIAR